MFKFKSNAAFNNILFSAGRIEGMHEVTQRLYLAAKTLRATEGQSAVAKLLNESPQTVKNWEARGVSKAGILKAASAIGVRAEWLATGAGEMQVSPSLASEGNVASAPAFMRPRRYPVISSVQAGEWCEIVDNFAPGDAEDWQDSPVDLGENGFILKLEGDSMTNPGGGKDNFPEGMYVHVHPGIEAQPGDYVIAKREHENKATFKKLVRVDGEQYLHAINPAWPKPYIKLEAGDRIVGKLKFAGWSF